MLLVLIVIELDISSKILKFREIGECSAIFLRYVPQLFSDTFRSFVQ